MIRGNYLVTLMGHFLGLLSTHETLGGVENVDESNCGESGDFCCGRILDDVVLFPGKVTRRAEISLPDVEFLAADQGDGCDCPEGKVG